MLGPTKEMQKAMQKAGLQFTDTKGRLLPMADIIKQLEPYAEDTGLMMELFGQRAGPAMMALVSQGSDALKQLTADMENSGGKAQEVSDIKMEGFNGKMRALQSAASGLSMAIGESLLPGLTQLAEKLTAALGPITEFAAAHPGLTSNVAAAAAAVVSFKVAIAGLRFAGLVGKGGALSLLSFAFNGIGGAAGGAKKAATEMVALQTALAGMDGKSLGALSRFKFALKGIAMSVPGVAPLGGALTAIGTAIGTISLPVWGGFAAAAAAVAAAGLSIYKHWDRITSILSGVGRAVGEELAPVLQAVQPALDVFAPIGQAIADGWNSAKSAMSGVMDWIGSAFSREILNEDQKAQLEASGHDVAERIIAAIKQVPAQLKAVADEWLQAGRELILSLWEGMKQVFSEMTAWLKDQLANIGNMAGNALSNVPLLGRFVGGGNNAGDAGDTPARAGGGPISRGQTYMVGEKGPELITANRNGYVNPAGQGGRQASSTNLTVNAPITINGVSADPAQLGAEVARQLREQIGEAFRGLQADAGMRFS
jgi:phage-related tail protein